VSEMIPVLKKVILVGKAKYSSGSVKKGHASQRPQRHKSRTIPFNRY
jgi:hypothetical protein